MEQAKPCRFTDTTSDANLRSLAEKKSTHSTLPTDEKLAGEDLDIHLSN